VLKHSHHPVDLRGTDTDRLARSGAEAVIFASDRTVAFLPTDGLELARGLASDVLLVEGYHARRLGRRYEVRTPSEARGVAAEIVRYVLERGGRRARPR
jgi:molybdopterin-guanine dinucleotide biosynthesis protein MobB